MTQRRRAFIGWAGVLAAMLGTLPLRVAIGQTSDGVELSAQFIAAGALAKEDQLPEAEALFKQIDLQARDPALATAARNNLGYCLFQRAKAAAGERPEQALPLFRSAASAYRAALDLTPGEANAAKGLELSRHWIKKLQDQQAAKGEQKDGNNSNSDDQNSDENSSPSPDEEGSPTRGKNEKNSSADNSQERAIRDLAQQQAQAADESAGKPERDGAKPPSEMQERQKELSRRTRDAKESLKKPQTAPPSAKDENPPADRDPAEQHPKESDAQKALDEAAQAQNKAEKALSDGDTKSAAQHQREAAEAIRRAADQLAADSAQQEPEHRGGQSDEDTKEQSRGVPQLEQPKRELDPLAKQLLDREQRQRAQRQRWLRGQMTKPPPVEKDW